MWKVMVGAVLTMLIGCSVPVPVSSKLTVKFQGQTADYWGSHLEDADANVRGQALQSLLAIGPESVPFIMKAMDSKQIPVKADVLHHIPTVKLSMTQQQKTQLLEKLDRMSQDPSNKMLDHVIFELRRSNP